MDEGSGSLEVELLQLFDLDAAMVRVLLDEHLGRVLLRVLTQLVRVVRNPDAEMRNEDQG